jgi:hypothetical protein
VALKGLQPFPFRALALKRYRFAPEHPDKETVVKVKAPE